VSEGLKKLMDKYGLREQDLERPYEHKPDNYPKIQPAHKVTAQNVNANSGRDSVVSCITVVNELNLVC
jgi:hypothetical protein